MKTRTIKTLFIGILKKGETGLYSSLRKERNLKIFHVSDVPDCVSVLEEKKPDIILVDLIRRDISTLDIFKSIRGLAPKIPVIYLGTPVQINQIKRRKNNSEEIPAIVKKGLTSDLLARMIRYEYYLRQSAGALAEEKRISHLMKSILKETIDTIFVKDLNGRYLIVNDIGAANFNKSPEELIGHDNSILDMPERTAKIIELSDRQVIENGESKTYEIELFIKGEKKYFLSTKSPYRDSEGNIKGVIGITRDITERKMIEEKLRAEHAYRKPIEEALLAGISAADLEGRLIYVNPAFCKMLGWEEKELLGVTTPYPFWPPEEHEYIRSVFQKKLAGIGPKEVEYRFCRKNGERFDVLVLTSPLTDGQGKKIGIVSTFTDITEIKTAKTKLQENLNLLRAVMEGTTDSVYVRDLNGHYLLANVASTRLVGKSIEEITGKRLEDVFPPETARQFKKDDQRVLSSGKTETFEVKINIKGRDRFYLTTKGPIKDDEGKVFGVFGVSRDITERKLAEDSQKHTLSLLNETIESTADGILVVDKDGQKVTLYNKKFLEMWHVPASLVETIQKTMNDRPLLSHVADQMKDPVNFIKKVQVLYKNHGAESFDTLDLADGRIFERYSKPQMREGNYYGRVWSFRDVTEKKRAEEELLKVQKLESLGLLAGGIAHDFNNILTGIIGNLSLARGMVKPQDELYKILKDASSASNRAAGLAMQLLTFAKGGEPVKTSFSFKELIEREVQFSLSGSNVQGQFDLPQDLWPINADRAQISQVIQNLIINAKQAMPEGGTIFVRGRNLDLTEEPNQYNLKIGKYVCVTVSDTGPGISKKIQSKIFDPYFSTKQKGSGLGLSIVYSIIKKHKGTIFLDSNSGKGASFQFLLPVGEVCAQGNNSPVESMEIKKETGFGLIIDDDVMVLKTAGKLLERLGYRVETALRASEGLEKVKAALRSGNPFDFVITDLTLPGDVEGEEILRQIKELDPRVKVIVSSGYSNDPVLSDYKNRGFAGYIKKPYRVEELSVVLDQIQKV